MSKVRFQGVDLSPEEVGVLFAVLCDAASDLKGTPDHATIVKLRNMLRSVPRPFDPRPVEYRVGSEGRGAIPILARATPDELALVAEWDLYDRSRRG
jgi:hypothetical protein